MREQSSKLHPTALLASMNTLAIVNFLEFHAKRFCLRSQFPPKHVGAVLRSTQSGHTGSLHRKGKHLESIDLSCEFLRSKVASVTLAAVKDLVKVCLSKLDRLKVCLYKLGRLKV